jgi:acyl-CoA synthetase (AMP-forming)/AMP-acid ligase II
MAQIAGRRDQQVKLRGFRVELGEIEAALAKHPAVVSASSSLATSQPAPAATKRLIAYFVSQGGEVSPAELRVFLSARVPDYQVPSAFVALPALPLSANGKVDRLRLPEPEASRVA